MSHLQGKNFNESDGCKRLMKTQTKLSGNRTGESLNDRVVAVNSSPAGFEARKDLPAGFLEFIAPLHEALTPRQRTLLEKRADALGCAQPEICRTT
jgi:hypothetical protein